jgi:hypothetical protein
MHMPTSHIVVTRIGFFSGSFRRIAATTITHVQGSFRGFVAHSSGCFQYAQL